MKTEYSQADARKYRKELEEVLEQFAKFHVALDKTMQKPSTPERGKRIAEMQNSVGMYLQQKMRFTLDYSWARIEKLCGVKL